jgi:hypothetical protein
VHRLAGVEAEARTEAAADDQADDTDDGPRRLSVDVQLVRDRRRERGAEEDAAQEPDVLEEAEPETPLVAVRQPDDDGQEDDEV